MKPNKLIRFALWLSKYSWGIITIEPVLGREQLIVIGKRQK